MKAAAGVGMPIIATPGSGSGLAEADGVTATPGLWALGRVPLDVAVRPSWELANNGVQAITLGTPHVEINEGCCPGALTYTGTTSLQPDQSTPSSPSNSRCTPEWTAATT